MGKLTKYAVIVPLSATLGSIDGVAYAAEGAIEEVFVTARAREETLQDVPISLTLVSGKHIEDAGIQNLEDLSTSVPNFTVTQDPIGDKINVRGIFTGEIASLEQSVSTFVDGVNHGRGTQVRFSFLDVERVEVLRGPQGTLFGKNTVGGALNITTRKPTEVFSAGLNLGYEFELEETEMTGFVSGPLGDTVRGRLAGATRNQREGWVENTFYDESTPTYQDYFVRGILDWDLTPHTLLRLRAEHGNFDLDGQPFGLRTAGPLEPLLSGTFGVESGSLEKTAIGQAPGSPLEIGSSGTMDGDMTEIALTLEHSLANGGGIEAIAAYSALEFERRLDADFSPLDLLGFDDTEDYEQTSLSLRYLSPATGRFRYVAGLYYQHVDLFVTGLTSLNTPTAAALTGAGCTAAGLSAADAQQLFASVAGLGGATPADAASQLAAAGSAAVVNTCTTFGATQVFPEPLSRVNTLDQQGDSIAVYGQGDWDLTDSLRFTLGLRHTVETKEATQTVFASTYGTRTLNTALDVPLGVLLEATPHVFTTDQLDRRENSTTYLLSLQWFVNNNLNTYLSASTGFKAGGFNIAAFGPSVDEAAFEEEDVVTYEIGAKATLLNGKAQLNGAIFYTNIKDLQVAQFTGSTSFIVQNAAEADIAGIEIDGRWLVTDSLALRGSAAYTDFEFASFPRAGCTVQQLLQLRQDSYDAGAALLADGDPNSDDAGFAAQLLGSNQTLQECSQAGINNLKGRTTEQVPKYIVQAGLDHQLRLGNGFVLDTLLDVVWNDEQFRQTDLDPETKSDAFSKTNLALSFFQEGSPWRVALIGRNIFDKRTFSYSNDTPLLDTARQQIIDRPRTVTLRVTYDL